MSMPNINAANSFSLILLSSLFVTNMSLGETPSEDNLAIMLNPNSRHVYVVPPGRPHCFVEHLALEGFSCRNWKEIPNSEKGVWSPDRHWTWNDDGSLVCTGKVAEDIPYEMNISSTPKYIETRITVTNNGQLTFRDLLGYMCLNARRSQPLHDSNLHHSFAQIDDQRHAMFKTDVSSLLKNCFVGESAARFIRSRSRTADMKRFQNL